MFRLPDPVGAADLLSARFLRGPTGTSTAVRHIGTHTKPSRWNNVDISNVWWNMIRGRARPTIDNNPLPFLPFWMVREWLGILLTLVYLFRAAGHPSLYPSSARCMTAWD